MQPVASATSDAFKFLAIPKRTQKSEVLILRLDAEYARLQNNPDGTLAVTVEAQNPRANIDYRIHGLHVEKDIQWSGSYYKNVRTLERGTYSFKKEIMGQQCILTMQGKNQQPWRIDGLVLDSDFFKTYSDSPASINVKKIVALQESDFKVVDLCVAEDSAHKLHLLVLRRVEHGHFVLTDFCEKAAPQ